MMQVVATMGGSSQQQTKRILAGLSGQSNCPGQHATIPPAEYQGNISDRGFILNRSDNQFEILNYPNNNNQQTGLSGEHGAELSLVKYLTDNLPNYEIYLVKQGWGDTPAYQIPPNTGFNRGYDWNVASRFEMYDLLLDQYKRALQLLSFDAIYHYHIQGESDIASATEYINYYNYSGALYRRLRQDLNKPLMKHIIAVFEATARTPYDAGRWASVRSDQLRIIAENPQRFINYGLDGKALETDNIHFTSAAQIQIGNDLGQIIIDDLI